MAQFFPARTTCRFDTPGERAGRAPGEEARRRLPVMVQFPGGAKSRGTLYGSEDAVKIVSMHSSKGLEFGLVLIPNLGEMPKKGEDEADEARLLYVAMTRAIDRLVMTYREPSSFTRRIQDSIGSVRQHLTEMDSQKVAG